MLKVIRSFKFIQSFFFPVIFNILYKLIDLSSQVGEILGSSEKCVVKKANALYLEDENNSPCEINRRFIAKQYFTG
ncbi:hypothetical protein ES708_26245 [subsurface metagenome]